MQIITVSSRYTLFNNSTEVLQYGQRGTSLVWQLPPGARYPFHWDSADCPFQLCIRPGAGNWNWSGAFQVSGAQLSQCKYLCIKSMAMCVLAHKQRTSISSWTVPRSMQFQEA